MLQKEIKKLEEEINTETLRKQRRENAMRTLQGQLRRNLRTLWVRQLKGSDFDMARKLINRDTNEIERLGSEIAILAENIAIKNTELIAKNTELAVKLITKIYKSPFIFLCDRSRTENTGSSQKENISTIIYYPSPFF